MRFSTGTAVDGSPVLSAALADRLTALNGQKGAPRSFDGLDAIFEEQAYRLSFWRVAAEEINYRRFFDVNDLAAIRMENPAVFAQAQPATPATPATPPAKAESKPDAKSDTTKKDTKKKKSTTKKQTAPKAEEKKS